jgi:hypothetical protein
MAQNDKRERSRILCGSIGVFSFYLFLTVGLSVVIEKTQEAAFACDPDMGQYLILQAVYFGFVAARNFAIVVLICYAKRPQRVRDLSNIAAIVVDLFIVVCATIYGSFSLFSPNSLFCRDNGNPDTFCWWIISMLCLVFGWIYTVLLCIGLTSLPLIIIFWCFYRMQMTEIANESRLQNIPIAGEIIRSLSRQRYQNTNQQTDQCVICLEQYRMED